MAVAHYFGQSSPLLGFDLIYEPADKLNHNQASLNRVYDKTIRTIHAIDPQRMIFIAPKLHAAPEDLPNLKLPPQSQNTVLAQWHIFPWGPLKITVNTRGPQGQRAEKAAIRARINTAIHWQQKTGHVIGWVGGWSPGETIRNAPSASQMAFARFMACELKKAKIPYAINADTQFYDGEEGAWRPALEPLLNTMIAPECEKPGEKPGHHTLKPPVPDATRVTPAEASKQNQQPHKGHQQAQTGFARSAAAWRENHASTPEPMFCNPPTSAPAVPAGNGKGSIAPLVASGNNIPAPKKNSAAGTSSVQTFITSNRPDPHHQTGDQTADN